MGPMPSHLHVAVLSFCPRGQVRVRHLPLLHVRQWGAIGIGPALVRTGRWTDALALAGCWVEFLTLRARARDAGAPHAHVARGAIPVVSGIRPFHRNGTSEGSISYRTGIPSGRTCRAGIRGNGDNRGWYGRFDPAVQAPLLRIGTSSRRVPGREGSAS